MNNKRRNEWDKLIDNINNNLDPHVIDIKLIVEANAHILKLERELQNLKGSRKVAAILKAKVVS